MDPLKPSSKIASNQDLQISAPLDPVSFQKSKLPDLGEKGKIFFKAVVLTGSSTFEKVKNYFGGSSKLSASKYKEAVLKEISDPALKKQIEGLNSVNDIRKALMGSATADANTIDAIASMKGKTATAKSDLGRLQDAAKRAGSSAKEKLNEIRSSFDPASRVKKEIISNIDKELKTSDSPELRTLRTEVAADTIYGARLAVNNYQLITQSEIRFEGNRPVNAEQYKRSVLSQLDNARNYAELNDMETRDYDRLRKAIDLAESPDDIQDMISEYNLDNFDPDEVNTIAQDASRYNQIDKLSEAAKNAIEKMKRLIT